MVYVKVEEFALQLAKLKYFSMNLNDLHNTIKGKRIYRFATKRSYFKNVCFRYRRSCSWCAGDTDEF